MQIDTNRTVQLHQDISNGLKEDIKLLTNEKDTLMSTLETYKRTIDSMNIDLTSLKNKLMKKEELIDMLEGQIVEVKCMRENAIANLDSMEREKRTMAAQINALEEHVTRYVQLLGTPLCVIYTIIH